MTGWLIRCWPVRRAAPVRRAGHVWHRPVRRGLVAKAVLAGAVAAPVTIACVVQVFDPLHNLGPVPDRRSGPVTVPPSGTSGTSEPVAVPEPGSAVLLATGLLIFFRRRARSGQAERSGPAKESHDRPGQAGSR